MLKELQKILYFEEKKRFVILAIFMLLLIILSFFLFQKAYSSYESSAKLNANISKALYVLKDGRTTFNLDSSKIIPSSTPYIYKFSVANFTDTKASEVDMEYSIKIRTTTNIPLTYELYRNQNYGDSGATNILTVTDTIQDADGAWYNVLSPANSFDFLYTTKTTDIYSLVITFPTTLKTNTNYADNIDAIEVTITSKQVI